MVPIPGGTPRSVSGTMWFPGNITAIVGVRRAGKATFLHRMRRERRDAGVPRGRLQGPSAETRLRLAAADDQT